MKTHALLSIFLAGAAMVLSGCGVTKGKAAAEQAVSQFHEQLDHGKFREIYAASHAEFKKASSEKDFVDLLGAIHRKLGAVQSTAQAGWNVNTFNFKTNVVLRYDTTFAGGKGAETFTYRIDDDKASLLGYHINSQALIIK